MKLTHKNTKDGRLYFGDKDLKYLKKVSRQSVETHHNSSVLYFEIDWVNSKRNFYGELIMKKFIHPKGIPVLCALNIKQGDASMFQGVPNKILNLTVSVYIDQLKELGIEPKLGDYFGVGKRLYEIYDKTIEDTGVGSLMFKRGNIRQDFFCIQSDDEVIQKNSFGENLGLESDIEPENF